MSLLKYLFFLAIIGALASCEGTKEYSPRTTFDSPFPKRNRNLENILGNTLTIKSGTDTLTLNISSLKNSNLITNNTTGDTIFYGTVSRFRGLYYFNQQINDSSYWIYAVKLADDLVYGLNTAWIQTMLIDRAIENGKHQKLVRYITPERIRLHPDKRELRYLFAAIIDSIAPDTILHDQEASPVLADTVKTISPIDPEELDLLSKAFPNPTTGVVNIELQQKNKITYRLTDLDGNTVLKGHFSGTKNKIDLGGQKSGIYSLILLDPEDNTKETIKIIKTN